MSTVTVTNTDAGLSGKTLMLTESNQTVDGLKTFNRGTSAPFAVNSGAAAVANLDADKLDGQEGTYYTNADNMASGTLPVARGGTGAATASANALFGGPVSGAAAAPAFRALVAADVVTEQTYTDTGTQNDVAPSVGATVIVRCTGAAPVITGFSGGAAGRKLLLVCLGTTLKVSDQTGSSAANQIVCESTNGQIVGVNGMILLEYDGTSTKWRATLLSPGAPIAWTPTIGGSGGQSGQAYNTQVGRYVQHGRMLTAWFNVKLSTLGTITTNVQIQSLPIASQNTTSLMSAFSLGKWANMTTACVFITGVLDAAVTAITLQAIFGVAAQNTQNVAQADLSATTQFIGQVTYPID